MSFSSVAHQAYSAIIFRTIFLFFLVFFGSLGFSSATEAETPPIVKEGIGSRDSRSEESLKKDYLIIRKDDISFYNSVVQILALFISVATVIFGAIVGVNVYQGGAAIKDARTELSDLKTELKLVKEAKDKYEKSVSSLKETADQIFSETVRKIEAEAVSTIKNFVLNEFEATTVKRYKQELLEELSNEMPSIEYVFSRLTDIINFPDRKSFEIYALCLSKFNGNEDILRVIGKALDISSQKYHG